MNNNTLINFTVKELVPRAIYKHRGESAIQCLDYRIVSAVDLLRDNLRTLGHDNAFVINNWHSGGNRQFCGLRTPDSADYSPTSQHTFGRALDIKTATPLSVIHAHIIDHPNLYSAIRFIEIDIGWLHVDCRDNADGSALKLWSPKRGFVSVKQYRSEL
jgi:hypothetical protein